MSCQCHRCAPYRLTPPPELDVTAMLTELAQAMEAKPADKPSPEAQADGAGE
jgi:hypothetical protein